VLLHAIVEQDMKIKIAESDAEIAACFAVLAELRPHLAEDSFIETIRRLEASSHFKLVYLQEGTVKAVAGIRISEWLHSGRYLEIEDLITTHTERSKGYGGMLFDWLHQYAKTKQCRQLRLVSGVARDSAHRFYLTKGMVFEAKYFSMSLS
jgi:GNAT superfamily N-acetyltransferase